ncbi:energy transducer TonB [Polyangium mundeleinium]|uniref:Energy transducer TonB n=1 Tax=Polyangium mundeleinium TaxID=2995306 RepID=A0ABT5EH21_9BACT|nr:energy transducer TonB [Polyangium mundeleinium]MDC0740639.1 energy transducer TonB [Polyangium mundeleinium]
MDEGSLRVGWLLVATAAHGALFGAGYLHDGSHARVRELREAIQAELDPFEVPVEPPPPPPEKPAPEPPEEPPPTPIAMQAPRPPQKDSADNPPKEAPEEPEPLPMAAPPVLVQQGLPDLSAVTFVTGIGEGTGLVSMLGAGLRPARRTQRGGGAPSLPRPLPPPSPDRSRPASLHGDRAWDCDFPSEAEAAGIRNVVVVLRILVRADGRAQNVEVVSDPGYGFGAQARFCAAQHHYRPALDRDGQPIQASLGPIRIRFVR